MGNCMSLKKNKEKKLKSEFEKVFQQYDPTYFHFNKPPPYNPYYQH